MKNEATHTKPQNGHLTIGLLENNIGHAVNGEQWLGVTDAAKERSVNLICFAGPSQTERGELRSQATLVYNLASADRLDGLIVWSGALKGDIPPGEEIEDFCRRYHPLPVVSAEISFAGIPSVLMDDYHSMREAIVHLIEVHGLSRVAFIRGPKAHLGVQERYRAYTETLAEYGIPLDPNLVSPPVTNWQDSYTDAMALTGLLLDERRAHFEAVVAPGAWITTGALAALQARGIHVPGEMAVVGFDDPEEMRATTPPLTTIRPPFYQMGQKAVEILLDQLEGKKVPEVTTLPGELIVRQSCACLPQAIVYAAVRSTKTNTKKLETALTTQREKVLAEMVQVVKASACGSPSDCAERLLDTFAADVGGQTQGAFLRELGETLGQVIAASGDVAAWQDAISALRRWTLPHLKDDSLLLAGDLWHQARVLIGETAEHAQAFRAVLAGQQTQTLREIRASLITTLDVDELMNVLARGLPRLDISSAYLSLYENSEAPIDRARLVLAYNEAGRIELESDGPRFPSPQLVPEGILPQDRPYSFVVQPLYFQENQIGFTLFEVGPREGAVYEALRSEISSALRGYLLLQARKEAEAAREKAYTEVERQVQERTAELQHEIAERQRTQDENLRLQQEVIEAQKQAIQELSTPVIPLMDQIIVVPLIGSVDSMRARDITRRLLVGIREHQARVVILDITGVPIVDSGVADHLNKTIQAARLKGARTIVTGISDAVAETIVDLGIDWSGVETLSDLQTGLRVALAKMGRAAREKSTERYAGSRA